VLVIGPDPYRVPGPWDPKPVADGVETDGPGSPDRAWGDAKAVITAAIWRSLWECVVIGGCTRNQLELSDRVVNLLRRHAPDAAIAFNANPTDTVETAARRVEFPG
jgi:hypothetical protein